MQLMEPGTRSTIKLLAALVDEDDEEGDQYRFLVDNKYVKYVTTEPGSLPGIDRTFAPDLLQTIPEFPSGEWTEGHIAKNKDTGTPFFSSTSTNKLPAVQTIWHHTVIDYLELQEVDRLRQGVHNVTHPSFDKPVIFKFAVFPWQTPYLEAETRAYSWIHGKGIGPQFLGHVTEGARVIGFLVECIEGATANFEDVDACRTALEQLHSAGIKHGDINKHNFLVKDGKATIVDFESAEKVGSAEHGDEDRLRLEFEGLEASLQDQSHRGGSYHVTVDV